MGRDGTGPIFRGTHGTGTENEESVPGPAGLGPKIKTRSRDWDRNFRLGRVPNQPCAGLSIGANCFIIKPTK